MAEKAEVVEAKDSEAAAVPVLVTTREGIVTLDPKVSKALAAYEKKVKDIEAEEASIKAALLKEMAARGLAKVETKHITILYIAPYTKKSFDTKKFKEEHSDLYDSYVKESTASACVKLSLNDKD